MKNKISTINKKNILIITIVLTIVAIIAIGTYALMLWTSKENTELTVRIGDLAGVFFDTGPNINVSNIGPVFDYEEDGQKTNFTITNYTSDDLMVTASLNITTISDNLKEESFKYVVMSSTDGTNYEIINEGNFASASNNSNISLVSSYYLASNGIVTYKVIIYIDGNMENPITMQGGSLSGVISVEAMLPPNMTLASYTVDGESQSTFPTVGSYNVDTSSCTDITATYDYTEKAFYVSNMLSTDLITCNPTLTSTTRTTLATYIKNLLGEDTSVASEAKTGNGSTLEKITDNGEEDYRYRGIDPANYIMFNNELWRIIGVFDDNTHGIADTHLVKIIRNDSIGAYVWDNRTTVGETTTSTNGWNNFPNSDIYNILNTAYYNHIDATGADYCYSYQTSLTGKCNFTRNGIQTEYQSMVESGVNWFLGGYSSANVTSSTMYGYERSSTKYSSNNATTVEAGLTVPVGLMYASDYGYAAPATCTSNLSAYNKDGCANKNWLKSNYIEWTLTHHSSNSNDVFAVYTTGILVNYYARYGYATRPTLYLKSNVFYLSGTGTQSDPYIIAM